MTQVADEQSGDEGYQFVWPPPDAEWPGFYSYWQPIILLRCKNLGLSREDAEDVAQDILTALSKKDKQSTLRFPNINALGGYVSTAVSNRCRKLHTKARRQRPMVEEATIGDHWERDQFIADFADLIPDDIPTAARFDWLLEQVSQQNREMFRLKYGQGVCLKEISELLNLPYTTLYGRHKSELDALRRLDRDAT